MTCACLSVIQLSVSDFYWFSDETLRARMELLEILQVDHWVGSEVRWKV
jgi:4-alpha-glucanotransferase